MLPDAPQLFKITTGIVHSQNGLYCTSIANYANLTVLPVLRRKAGLLYIANRLVRPWHKVPYCEILLHRVLTYMCYNSTTFSERKHFVGATVPSMESGWHCRENDQRFVFCLVRVLLAYSTFTKMEPCNTRQPQEPTRRIEFNTQPRATSHGATHHVE